MFALGDNDILGASKHCQPPRNGRISITVLLCCTGLADSGIMRPMKYWEIVADKLSAADDNNAENELKPKTPSSKSF